MSFAAASALHDSLLEVRPGADFCLLFTTVTTFRNFYFMVMYYGNGVQGWPIGRKKEIVM